MMPGLLSSLYKQVWQSEQNAECVHALGSGVYAMSR